MKLLILTPRSHITHYIFVCVCVRSNSRASSRSHVFMREIEVDSEKKWRGFKIATDWFFLIKKGHFRVQEVSKQLESKWTWQTYKESPCKNEIRNYASRLLEAPPLQWLLLLPGQNWAAEASNSGDCRSQGQWLRPGKWTHRQMDVRSRQTNRRTSSWKFNYAMSETLRQPGVLCPSVPWHIHGTVR